MGFPLAALPDQNWRDGRGFGARREGNRLHAGCDLIVPEGTEIYAVAPGRVSERPYAFYHNTWAIEVTHPNFVARYCEIREPAPGIALGSIVEEGMLIAFVGRMYVDSMLHFEMYDGTAHGGLTDRSRPPYCRRRDLIDPTPYLNDWARAITGVPNE